MDKFLIRKDVYEDLIEKGYGKKDLSKLTKKQITDKNGHKRTVYVRNGEQPAVQNQPKAQDELSPEKKARYEEMLEKVKAGPDENALFVRGKGMLNKKDAIAHLSEKLGKKPVNSAYEGHLESDNPPNTDITKEDEERFGKQALSGLSGKRTSSEETKKTESENITYEQAAKAVKEGKTVQWKDRNGKWNDVDPRTSELVMARDMGSKLRVKPDGNEKPTQDDMKSEKKSSKELKKEIEDLRSEYREKYDSLSAKEKNEYVKKFDELEAEIDKTETEETGMNKFERRGYEGTIENKWLDKTKLPQIKENAEAKIKGYENLLNDLKNDKTKKNSVQRESYEVNLAIAQDNLDEWKGKLKAINEMMEKASKKNTSETKNSVNGFKLDDIYHHGSGKELKKVDDMKTAKGVVEMIARKYGATDKGCEQLMDFIAYNIGGGNPLYDKLYEEYGVDAYDLDMDFEASHDLILNQALGKDTKGNREQIEDSKNVFERKYRQMLEREG